MPELDLLTTTGADGRDLLTAARSNWSRPITHCPDWNAAQLVAHMGAILAWIAAIVTTGERVSRRDQPASANPPVEIADDIEERVRTLCMALSEATVGVDEPRSPASSTAYSFTIRRRSFCLLGSRGPNRPARHAGRVAHRRRRTRRPVVYESPVLRLMCRSRPDRGAPRRPHRLGGNPRTRN